MHCCDVRHMHCCNTREEEAASIKEDEKKASKMLMDSERSGVGWWDGSE